MIPGGLFQNHHFVVGHSVGIEPIENDVNRAVDRNYVALAAFGSNSVPVSFGVKHELSVPGCILVAILDLDRHAKSNAIGHCPALGRNLIPELIPITLLGCFSDVTQPPILIPGFIKKDTDSPPTFVNWEARDKLIRIGVERTEGAVKGSAKGV
jgi:hypothetical protein